MLILRYKVGTLWNRYKEIQHENKYKLYLATPDSHINLAHLKLILDNGDVLSPCESPITEKVKSFLKCICWTLSLYQHTHCIDIEHYYGYKTSPTPNQIIQYILRNDVEDIFSFQFEAKKHRLFKPAHAMFVTLPIDGVPLMPISFQDLYYKLNGIY